MPEDLQGEYKYVMVLPNTDIRASSNPTIEGIGIYHPIPEPATLTLLAMGAGLFIRKRNHPK
jgi:hypothetical protein